MKNISFYAVFMLNEPSDKRSCSQSILAKGIRTLRPPFINVKLAFKNSDVGNTDDNKTLLSYYMSADAGMCKVEFPYKSNLYGFVEIRVREDKFKKLINILNRMSEESKSKTNPHRFSAWKATNIEQTTRHLLCMIPMPLPDKNTRAWTCSEVVCFVLQQIGIIDNLIHPTYVDSSELFLILRGADNVNTSALSPIHYDPNGTIQKENTSAESRYCHAMKCKRRNIPSYDRINSLSSKVIEP
jgi:hypothetical protein